MVIASIWVFSLTLAIPNAIALRVRNIIVNGEVVPICKMVGSNLCGVVSVKFLWEYRK